MRYPRWWAALVTVAGLALPDSGQGQEIRTELDIPYLEGATARQAADLYLPTSDGFPTLVFVHGGSLTSGDRKGDSIPAVCRRLAQDGVGCVSVGYRLFSDSVAWPSPRNDVAAAYAWVRANVAARGGDLDRVFVGGHSSGCHLASIVSTDPAALEPHGMKPADVPGVVAMGCRLDVPLDLSDEDPERVRRYFAEHRNGKPWGSWETYRNAWPMSWVGPDLPPFLVLIAEAERINPPIEADALRFQERMRAHGNAVQIEILPDRRHMTALTRMSDRDDPTRALIVAFVRSIRLSGPAM